MSAALRRRLRFRDKLLLIAGFLDLREELGFAEVEQRFSHVALLFIVTADLAIHLGAGLGLGQYEQLLEFIWGINLGGASGV